MDIHYIMIYRISNKSRGSDISMSPRTGRPPKEDSRENQYRLRMSNDELHKLEVCCQKKGLSKAEVIRKGIDLVYKEVSEQ